MLALCSCSWCCVRVLIDMPGGCRGNNNTGSRRERSQRNSHRSCTGSGRSPGLEGCGRCAPTLHPPVSIILNGCVVLWNNVATRSGCCHAIITVKAKADLSDGSHHLVGYSGLVGILLGQGVPLRMVACLWCNVYAANAYCWCTKCCYCPSM